MAENSDRAAWRVTTDRKRIREWAEDHGVVPVRVDTPSGSDESGGANMGLVSNPDDDREKQLSWDEFFERFKAERLALRHRETILARGGVVRPAPAGVPTADGLVRVLALRRGQQPVADPWRWEPDYLRASGAERARTP
jgi:hypothetical protein